MPKKELSPYPPDRWIRQVNRTYPNLWTDLRKGYADPGKAIHPMAAKHIMMNPAPDWCVMPTLFPFLLLSARYGESYYIEHLDELMTLSSTYLWRCSKGIYRVAPEVYNALISQPVTGNLPADALYHLPEWAVYIETPGLTYERRPMEGFIAHLDYNIYGGAVDLQFAIFMKDREMPRMVALPLGTLDDEGRVSDRGAGTLSDAMERLERTDSLFIGRPHYVGDRSEYKQTFSAMIQLLLYLCSEEPDMPEIEHPKQRRTLCGGVRAPETPRVWDVGVRISHVLRGVRNRSDDGLVGGGAPGTHASPRPHIRSAHWQTYWVGPRTASFPVRKPVLRWIPPIPVGVDWRKELPTNIRMVGE